MKHSEEEAVDVLGGFATQPTVGLRPKANDMAEVEVHLRTSAVLTPEEFTTRAGVMGDGSDHHQDEALLARARQGDAEAMEVLLALHEKPLYRFGLRMCGSEEAAKEVLQQTLLTAFQSLHAFRGEARLSTWLFQIARSFCGKAHRRSADTPEIHQTLDTPEALELAAPGATPEDSLQARELGELLRIGILALPESHREALILRDVEGLSAEEAARVLGVEVANLKTRLHRARMELRQHLSALLDAPAHSGECAALSAELADFVAQDIEKATCERIEAHLSTCAQCASACDSLKRSVSLCRRIPGDAVPAPVRTAVRRALHAAAGLRENPGEG